jgi:hypothetical protein
MNSFQSSRIWASLWGEFEGGGWCFGGGRVQVEDRWGLLGVTDETITPQTDASVLISNFVIFFPCTNFIYKPSSESHCTRLWSARGTSRLLFPTQPVLKRSSPSHDRARVTQHISHSARIRKEVSWTLQQLKDFPALSVEIFVCHIKPYKIMSGPILPVHEDSRNFSQPNDNKATLDITAKNLNVPEDELFDHPWKYLSYRIFSRWAGSEKAFLVVRQFSTLNARIIL